MPDYTLYVEDDRYTVPTLSVITAADDARALTAAYEHLRASAYHRSIEVCRDGTPIFKVER